MCKSIISMNSYIFCRIAEMDRICWRQISTCPFLRSAEFFIRHNPNSNSVRIELGKRGKCYGFDFGDIYGTTKTGTYFFSFTGSALFSPLSGYVKLGVSLYLNGNIIGKAFVQEYDTTVTHWYPLAIQSTLNLKSGDKVWVQIDFW